MDKFGAEVEYDFFEIFRIDILDFFTGRYTWPRFFSLLHQLPRHSNYQAAKHNDDEWADAIVPQLEDDKRPYHPPATTWTQEAELLALIADLLGAQRADYGAVNSKNHKRKDPKPVARPQTAIERAKKRAELKQHQDVVRRMLPWKQ